MSINKKLTTAALTGLIAASAMGAGSAMAYGDKRPK